jgi:hypothetical protein
MTPPRLVQLQCPACAAGHWTIESDCTGAHLRGMPELSYEERHYTCSACAFTGPGYHVLQKSPPEFLLQPHAMYPMTREDFDHWVGILRTHFPDHPALPKLGQEFVPYSAEQAEEDRRAFEAEHPVAWIRDQDGASRRNPQFDDGAEWLDMMVPDDILTFENREGNG